jgi:diaminohydroxyphosphoribosylaminopyrimidine deaminase / 5-amino-6-(5-phosphoribosylamino)uracil reductase
MHCGVLASILGAKKAFELIIKHLNIHETYITRCLQLAALANGYVAPNPMVGSILVYNNKIIAEGYHQAFGQAHAEVNCINNVQEKDKALVNQSTLYVSLEPCSHYGKTPPCTSLIISSGIKKVVIGSLDVFEERAGKGVELLKQNGIEVITGILENECKALNKYFNHFHLTRRPYIILKWAQTANGYIQAAGKQRTFITNELANIQMHKLRSQVQAILVGTGTAAFDNPALTVRNYSGKNPVRLVIDTKLKLPLSLRLFNTEAPTIVLNRIMHTLPPTADELQPQTYYYKTDENYIQALNKLCSQLHIQSVLVEGGAYTINEFIKANVYNQIIAITNNYLTIPVETIENKEPVAAPVIPQNVHQVQKISLQNNTIATYLR